MPRVEAAHLRAAATHGRVAVVHEEAAQLFDGMGLRSLARDERARARLDRDGAATERGYAAGGMLRAWLSAHARLARVVTSV